MEKINDNLLIKLKLYNNKYIFKILIYKMSFTVVTWNVNFSGRTVDEYEPFSFANRSKYILND